MATKSKGTTRGTEKRPAKTAAPSAKDPKDPKDPKKSRVGELTDDELRQLVEVVLHEAERRGKLPLRTGRDPIQPTRLIRDATQKRPNIENASNRKRVEATEVTLSPGKLNAVRAAFKAGVTPSRIARQFGISQANVRKALAAK